MKYKTDTQEEGKPCPVKSLINALNTEISLAESALSAAKSKLTYLEALLDEDND